MQFRLETKSDVRKFAVTISVVALIGCGVLQFLMLPSDVYDRVLFRGLLISVILALPISYFVGMRLRDVNELSSKLAHAVDHDNLTGLCTRTSFYKRLDGLEDTCLVTIATDIDHFKRINDEFGHKAGDDALKQFALTLLRNCREEDVVARFGGEEFVILLRETTLEEGINAAQRLCDRVRKKVFVINSERLRITASFGVAALTSIDQIDDAINQADLASYRAKREGRDRVCHFDPKLDIAESSVKAAE